MIARAFFAVGVVSTVLLACGSSSDSEFGNENRDGSSGNASSSGGFGGSSSSGGSSGSSGFIGQACATSNANGQAEPVSLVFMVDRSGSMKFNPSPNLKWDSVLAGLKAFFADQRSAGLSASTQVFPQFVNNDACNVGGYSSPLVALTALPDTAGALGKSLDANGPSKDFNTPTVPALKGAVAQAQQLRAQGKKVAVVLVTDGEPNGCSSNVASSATAAGTGLPDVRTYVIGVGDQLANLNSIALGGGSTKAVLISDANPAQITTDLVAALGEIRKQALGCDYALPAPPNGEQLDISRVNVQWTPNGGATQALDYNGDCTGGKGWRYDSASAPTKILICEQSCGEVLANASGKIDIVFGCKTQGGSPK
jgi:hypothetical protein